MLKKSSFGIDNAHNICYNNIAVYEKPIIFHKRSALPYNRVQHSVIIRTGIKARIFACAPCGR